MGYLYIFYLRIIKKMFKPFSVPHEIFIRLRNGCYIHSEAKAGFCLTGNSFSLTFFVLKLLFVKARKGSKYEYF